MAYYKEEQIAAALKLYFELGEERSIEKLRKHLRTLHGKAPSHRTLQNWSKKYEWQKKLKELGKMPDTPATRRVLEKIALDTFVAKSELRALGGYLVRRAYEELDADGAKVLDKDTMHAFNLLAQNAIDLVKAASVEEGGVSDRVAETKTIEVDDRREQAETLVDFIVAAKKAGDEKSKPQMH